MTATTTEGTGLGVAGQSSKGPDGGNRAIFQTLNASNVSVVGEIVAGSGEGDWDGRVTFNSPLTGSNSNYEVILVGESSSTHATVTAKANDGDGNFASFDVSTASNDTVKFMVFFRGGSNTFSVTSLE